MANSDDDCVNICALLISLVLLLALIFLIGFIFPSTYRTPHFHLQSVAATTPITLSNTSATTTVATTSPSAAILTTGFNITYWVTDPSLGFLYQPANVSVYYHHHDENNNHHHHRKKADAVDDYYLSSTTLESFWPSTAINIAAPSVPVSDERTASYMGHDIEAGEFGITVKVVADFRKYGSKWHSNLKVTCKDVKIAVKTGAMVGDPRTCKVVWDSNKWFHFKGDFW